MYYSLQKNVYLVNGAVYSCLYNLNSHKLYHINKNVRDLIELSFRDDTKNIILTTKEKIVLENLEELGLINKVSSKMNFNQGNPEFKKSLIDFAWIEVTTKCNLKCIHCYEESCSQSYNQMDYNDFLKAISLLKDLNIKKIQLIGGEPFIVGKDLEKMIKAASTIFESIEIFTNGTLITPAWIDLIKKYNLKIALSVYSYIDSEHDKVTTVKGSHKKTISTIKALNEAGIKYRVCNVLMDGINIGNKNTSLYTLSNKKDIVRISGRAGMKLLNRDLIRKKLITLKNFTVPINDKLFYKMKSGHNCFSSRIYISSDLIVYPCVMERRIWHGTIGKIKFDKLIKDSILKFDKNQINGCKECEYRYMCFDCRPNSLDNNILSKPWYCTYNPHTGEWTEPEKFIDDLCQQYILE